MPALVTEQGPLTESPGLLGLRGAAFSGRATGARLGSFALAQMQEFNSYLCSTVHVAHAHGRRGSRWADDVPAIEAMKQKVPAIMTECAELIERKMLKGPWVMGEQYTICDPYLFTIASWFEGDGVDTAKLPESGASPTDAGAPRRAKGRRRAKAPRSPRSDRQLPFRCSSPKRRRETVAAEGTRITP